MKRPTQRSCRDGCDMRPLLRPPPLGPQGRFWWEHEPASEVPFDAAGRRNPGERNPFSCTVCRNIEWLELREAMDRGLVVVQADLSVVPDDEEGDPAE